MVLYFFQTPCLLANLEPKREISRRFLYDVLVSFKSSTQRKAYYTLETKDTLVMPLNRVAPSIMWLVGRMLWPTAFVPWRKKTLGWTKSRSHHDGQKEWENAFRCPFGLQFKQKTQKQKGVPTPNIHTHSGGWMDAESLRPRHDVETMVVFLGESYHSVS